MKTQYSFMGLFKFAAIVFFLVPAFLHPQKHPRLWGSDDDKPMVLEKISRYSWANDVYTKILNEVEPYADRHVKDSEWLLSRMPLNRIPGKRYTHIVGWRREDMNPVQWGDAPIPTIWRQFPTSPLNSPDGFPFVGPNISDLPMYSSGNLRLKSSKQNSPWYETNHHGNWVIRDIYIKFATLAERSAFLYWITSQEKYAKMSLDLLDLFSKGVYHVANISNTAGAYFDQMGGYFFQEMIQEGPIVLSYASAYDFIFPYLKSIGYNDLYVTNMILRYVDNAYHRDSVQNNHTTFDATKAVMAALVIDAPEAKEWIDKFLYVSWTHPQAAVGHKSIKNQIADWITPEGPWFETPSYAQGATEDLVNMAVALLNNGINLFDIFPVYFDFSFGFSQYVYPNQLNLGVGDSSRWYANYRTLEMMNGVAEKLGKKTSADKLRKTLLLLDQENVYSRGQLEYKHLFYAPGSLGKMPADSGNAFPRSDYLSHMPLWLQRNSMDREYGLMYSVHGGSFSHSHASGMALELYGAGQVVGADPGHVGYLLPEWREYYSQFAAHNTVIADGRSCAGSGSPFDIIKLNNNSVAKISMEPEPRQEPLSENCSYTYTSFYDSSTSTEQKRLLAIVRTSDKTGYYVDIYHSDNANKNEYLYHNIGEGHELWYGEPSFESVPLTISDTPSELTEHYVAEFNSNFRAYPGYKYFTDKKGTANLTNSVISRFAYNDNSSKGFSVMNLWMAGNENRRYFKAKSPAVMNLTASLKEKKQLVFVARQTGSAWDRPFAAIYEPFRSSTAQSGGASIRSIRTLSNHLITAIEIDSLTENGWDKQYVLHSLSNNTYTGKGILFSGTIGVITLRSNEFHYIYMGKGTKAIYSNWGLASPGNTPVTANLEREDGNYRISCGENVKVTLPWKSGDGAENISNMAIFLKTGTAVIKLPGQNRILGSTPQSGTLEAICRPVKNGELLILKEDFNNFIKTDITFSYYINGSKIPKNKIYFENGSGKETFSVNISANFGVRFSSCVVFFNNKELDSNSFHYVKQAENNIELIFEPFSLVPPGSYRITIKDAINEAFEDTFTIMREDSVSIIEIYPNPFNIFLNEKLTISVPPTKVTETSKIFIYQMNGNLIQEFNLNSYADELGIVSLEKIQYQPGLYFVVWKDNDKVIETKKLIIIK